MSRTKATKREAMTPEEHQSMLDFREEWLRIGHSTDPADRHRAEAAITAMYGHINEPALYVWWCDSPMQAVLVMTVLKGGLRANLGANLRDNLRANLGANLEDNLGANLRANLRDNLGANLRTFWHWGAWEWGWIPYYTFPQRTWGLYPERDITAACATSARTAPTTACRTNGKS